MGTKYISRKKNRRGNWVKYRDDRLVTAQQSTGAAQIANLKYILKNGSTGEFVEALDSIINERVRVALGQLVNNLDKGTGLAKVLGIDASNDLGSSSLANLASMLSDPETYQGIELPTTQGSSIKVDTFANQGVYAIVYRYNGIYVFGYSNGNATKIYVGGNITESIVTISNGGNNQAQVTINTVPPHSGYIKRII